MFLWGGDLERGHGVGIDREDLDCSLIDSPFVVVLSAHEVRARPVMMSVGMEGFTSYYLGGELHLEKE